MDQARFEAMVTRLEHESAQAPGRYQARVAALTLLGFVILAVVIGFAGLGLLLLAGLALAILLSGGKALILLVKLGKLLILLAIPLWWLVKSSLRALFRRLPSPQGVEVTREQAPQLFAALDRMRERMSGPRFHHVLVTDEVNAAVVQRPLFGLFGFPRNYLILGLPLLEAMAAEEALAVVAHEYGHLAGSHSRFAAFVYRLRLSWGTIQTLSEQWQGWGSRPLQKLVGWYAPYFNAYTFVMARANEYQADAASAELVGPGAAARALKRVNLVAPQYERFNEQTLEAVLDQPSPPPDRATRWAGAALLGADEGQRRVWLGEALMRTPHPMDTHPALRQRLAALPGPGAEVDALPQPLDGPSAATAWLGGALETLRNRMQSEWHAQLSEPWKQRHDELQQRKQRLAALEELAEPNVDDLEERLRLRLELLPGQDHVPALTTFNADHPDRPVMVFLEGRERLAHGDEIGLTLLERTIELEPELTRAASECAWNWLSRRADERARAWQQRWIERSDFEARREHELRHLDADHALRPHDLGTEDLERVRRLVHGTEGVRAAFLMRRVLPSAPEVATYVLGLQLTRWASFRSRGPTIVGALASREWPMHVFIVALDGNHKAMRQAMAQEPSARLALS